MANIKQHSVFPLLTCVVKECQPNGLGDMLITIKVIYGLCTVSILSLYATQKWLLYTSLLQDPTGTVRASVHAKVLKDSEFGSQIAVGSVLVLKNVFIFHKTLFFK